jgi:hypothetical protein
MTLYRSFAAGIACTFAIAFAGAAWAADVCVDPDDGSCFPTLQAAIDDAGTGPGDTLKIEKGTYAENVVVDKSLRLEGERGVVILAPDGAPGILVSAAGVELKKLTVRGPRDDDGIRIEAGADDATIDEVSVTDVESEDCIETSAQRTTVKDSRIEACGFACIFGSGDYLTVEDTELTACLAEGVLALGDAATVEGARIARTGSSCVGVTGDGATVYRTDASNCYLCGIDVIGDGARIARSRASSTLLDGICGSGDGAELVGNRTRNTLLSGIFWVGQASLQKNEVEAAGFYGMELAGEALDVRRNEVQDSGGDPTTDCYLIDTEDSTFERNEAEDCSDDGFDVIGNANKLVRNEAEGNVDNGFEVSGADNRLEDNEADDSGSFDLCDEGTGTSLKSNDFDTQAFSDCVD